MTARSSVVALRPPQTIDTGAPLRASIEDRPPSTHLGRGSFAGSLREEKAESILHVWLRTHDFRR